MPDIATNDAREDLTVDELARRAGVPTRTIREYQTLGLLPSPERHGRVAIYGAAHLRRLALIARLQQRGYSLAAIRDLLTAWSDGHDLTDILGAAPDELVHVDEPGAPASIDQLTRLLPDLVPRRLEDLLAVGVVEQCGPDRYCIPSPSLLQLTIDALDAGYRPKQVLELLTAVHDAATTVATATIRLLDHPPAGASADDLAQLATRGRGLLAHGTGRMAIYELGRRLDPTSPARRTRTSR